MSDSQNTFWGKLAVVAALLSALAAFLGVLHQLGLFTNPERSYRVASNTDNNAAFLENDMSAPRKPKPYTKNEHPSDFNFDNWYNKQIDEMSEQGIIDPRERKNLYMPNSNY